MPSKGEPAIFRPALDISRHFQHDIGREEGRQSMLSAVAMTKLKTTGTIVPAAFGMAKTTSTKTKTT